MVFLEQVGNSSDLKELTNEKRGGLTVESLSCSRGNFQAIGAGSIL
jgi:hypothetical protein